MRGSCFLVDVGIYPQDGNYCHILKMRRFFMYSYVSIYLDPVSFSFFNFYYLSCNTFGESKIRFFFTHFFIAVFLPFGGWHGDSYVASGDDDSQCFPVSRYFPLFSTRNHRRICVRSYTLTINR